MPGSLRQLQERSADPTQTFLTVKDAVRCEILTRVTFVVEYIVRVGGSNMPSSRTILEHARGRLEYVSAQVRHVSKPASTRQSYKHILREVLGLGTISDASNEIPLERSSKALDIGKF